ELATAYRSLTGAPNARAALTYGLREVEVREAIAQADPGDLEAKHELAWTYELLGAYCRLRLRNPVAARDYGLTALELRTAILPVAPEKVPAGVVLPQNRINLLSGLLDLGEISGVSLGDPATAEKHYREIVNLLEEPGKRPVSDYVDVMALAVAHNRLGHLQ